MTPPRFDPYAILRELEAERVSYVVIGALARVIQGLRRAHRRGRPDPFAAAAKPRPAPDRARTPQRVPRRRRAARARRGHRLRRNPSLELRSDAGEIKLVLEPEGTRGYDDLRHRANHQPIGEGLRPAVANPGDLVRMLESHGRDADRLTLETMQRAIELDRGLGWER